MLERLKAERDAKETMIEYRNGVIEEQKISIKRTQEEIQEIEETIRILEQ